MACFPTRRNFRTDYIPDFSRTSLFSLHDLDCIVSLYSAAYESCFCTCFRKIFYRLGHLKQKRSYKIDII